MACTTILVGKNASYDGSTLVARNEDSGAGEFTPKKLILVNKDEQARIYKSVISHLEIELPDNPMNYTAVPDALHDKGDWAACGVNELNISMTATETITSNERVLGADPLVKLIPERIDESTGEKIPEKVGGIGEEDIVTLVLPYIKSAREGVIRLGSILEKYGSYEMNGIAFQDVNEIWWLETIGGHHWIARRLPDDCYAIIPNQLGLDYFNLEDALGEKKEYMCSSDLLEFINKNHLDLSLDNNFNARYAFGSNADSDHIYNTPRAWISQRYLNRNSNFWDGDDADFRPDSDDIPWCRVPERKITVEDVKYILSNHFQSTAYDPYNKFGDPSNKGVFRPIGVNRTNFLSLVQIRPYMPEAIRSIQWLTYGSNVYNAFVPLYANVNLIPEYFSNTSEEIKTDSFYWANRLIGALADPHYNKCSSHIERYQLGLQSSGHELLNKYDNLFLTNESEDARAFCQKANEEISNMTRIKTNDLLGKVLYEASSYMKNAFSRSDA